MSYPLREYCEFIVDCPHSTAPDEGAGHPIIRTPNVGPGYLILEGVQRVSEETYNKRNVRAVPQNGDLILAREAPAGNVAIINSEEKVCLGQRTVLIRPDSKKINPWFLNYYLNAPEQQHALLKNANGATVSHVNMPIIRELPIDVPELAVQRRIAEILFAYDELIENNRKQIKLLEEAAQRLYKEWFIDYKYPGYETALFDVENDLPEGWKLGVLGDLIHDVGRRIKKEERDAFAHYLPIDAIPAKSFSIWESDSIENAESSLIAFGSDDFVFGAMRPYFHKVICSAYPGITRSTCFVLREHDARDHAFAFLTLFYEKTIKYATTICVGTTMPYVRWRDFSEMPVILPPKEVTSAFGCLVNPLIKQVKLLSKQCAEALESRDRLLPKLMSGEIEVS